MARAAVEALLRNRKLDRTLTSALPERLGDDAVAAFDIAALDHPPSRLEGRTSYALPRGQVSEVVGPVSSGRTSLAWAALAAATRRGESVALIDTFDRLDPPTAHACGIELSRLLWVRGAGTALERAIDRALKALNLVVQSGVCSLVVIDLVDVPASALRRLPAATWFRIARAIAGSDTAVLILAATPIARSAGGRSIALQAGNGDPGTGTRVASSAPGSRVPAPGVLWKGDHDRSRRVAGVRTTASVSAARWSQPARVALDTLVINAV